jgi:hypothetical protein
MTTRTDHHLIPPQEPRSFSSFDQAAHEAATSRLYGGIYFPLDNDGGLSAGRCIGEAIIDRVRFRDEDADWSRSTRLRRACSGASSGEPEDIGARRGRGKDRPLRSERQASAVRNLRAPAPTGAGAGQYRVVVGVR